jgi:hypothetical protein
LAVTVVVAPVLSVVVVLGVMVWVTVPVTTGSFVVLTDTLVTVVVIEVTDVEVCVIDGDGPSIQLHKCEATGPLNLNPVVIWEFFLLLPHPKDLFCRPVAVGVDMLCV